jgi:hypothetical protein
MVFAILGGLVILSAVIDPLPLWRAFMARLMGGQDEGDREDEQIGER